MSTLPHRDDLGRRPIIEVMSIPALMFLWDSDRYFYPVAEEGGRLVYPDAPPENADQVLVEAWFFGRELYPAPGDSVFTAAQARALEALAESLDLAALLAPARDDLTRTQLRLLAALGPEPQTGEELAARVGCSHDTARRYLPELASLGLVRRVRAGYVRP